MEIETLKFKSFKSKEVLAQWFNEGNIKAKVMSVVKDVSNGEWVIWYVSAPELVWQYKTTAMDDWQDASEEEYESGKDLSRLSWRQIEK